MAGRFGFLVSSVSPLLAMREGYVIDFGPLKVQAEVKERHSIPPVLSWALLGGGLVVLVLGFKKKA